MYLLKYDSRIVDECRDEDWTTLGDGSGDKKVEKWCKRFDLGNTLFSLLHDSSKLFTIHGIQTKVFKSKGVGLWKIISESATFKTIISQSKDPVWKFKLGCEKRNYIVLETSSENRIASTCS